MSHLPESTDLWLTLAGIGAMLVTPFLVLWHFFWTEPLVDRWTIYRLRVARQVKRAEYIRWWRTR